MTTIPADPIAPAADASDAAKQYALLLGGIANLINNVAIQSGAAAPTYDMVVAVTFDLVDGQFDGQYFGDSNVPGSGATPVSLPQNLDFDAEVNRFRNNNASVYEGVILPTIEVTSFGNSAPTAVAGAPLTVPQGADGQLDGSGSSDPESGVFFRWLQTAGTDVTLDNDEIASPTFTAPQRLIGSETLTFELTAIDPLGFSSVDTVDVTVVGALPNDFYVVDDGEITEENGIDVDGGGRITLTDDTNGTLLSELGPSPFTYQVNGNDLIIDFATPFNQDDFDEERDIDNDGVTDGFFLVEENVDRFIFTLLDDNPNGDIIDIAAIGETVIKPLDDPDATPILTEPLNDPGGDPITVYDIAQIVPFPANLANTRRTLFFNSFDLVSSLENDDELYSELFAFVDEDRGMLRDSGATFTYEVDADGILVVTFSNGDEARYINLLSRPEGDIVATEYTLDTPFFPGDSPLTVDVFQSLAEDSALTRPTDREDVAGVYTGLFDDDDLDVGAQFYLRLNPDGTGSINFDRRASRSPFFDFDDVFAFRSNFGVCWDIDADGTIIVDRAFSTDVSFPGTISSETDPSFCSSLTEANTELGSEYLLLDIEGPDFLFFSVDTRNRCAFQADEDCSETPVLDDSNYLVRIFNKEPLLATPPVAGLDFVQTPSGTPVTIDLLANDVECDRDIDPTSVVIGRGPFQGTITMPYNPATGLLTYTPNPGIRSDVFEYTVADDQGNRSQIQIAQISINDCPPIDGFVGDFDANTNDCIYEGFGSPLVAVTDDVDLNPLPNGGAYKFLDTLVIGQDFSSDAAAGGITAGGQGPSLNIAAGTLIAFDFDAALVINRGSQINVAGTDTNPVIMTSTSDVDHTRDIEQGGPGFLRYNSTEGWGGIEINGFGITNQCVYTGSVAGADLALLSECHVLAQTGLGHFGGINNGDSSGSINYLQIKYSGAAVGFDHLNGLGLFGVGSNTMIQNVQVYSTFDDGFELVGGAVDLSNIAVLYAKDDSLDIDAGYSGDIENALLIQDQLTGNLCVEVDSIADFEFFDSTGVSNIIAQGLNGLARLTNLTCVMSASDLGDPGAGFKFREGAFAQVRDSVVTMAGIDDFTPFNNACVTIEDRSLQALDDMDLGITSTLFACTDQTAGNQTPSFTFTDAFLTSAGNQFATFSTIFILPPPVASAGEGLNLLEGSPLIFSPPPAAVLIDSAAPLISTTSFFGAVQQANDWTDGWTFGLRDGARIAPLWYEVPMVFTSTFVPTAKGELVSLTASASTGQSLPLSYQWNQLSGPPIIFSNPTGISTTFNAPGVGTNLTEPGGRVEVELLITDNGGLSSSTLIEVEAGPSIPQDFYSASESIISFQFGRFIEGGARVKVIDDFTGEYISSEGIFQFVWNDSPTDFVMDFSGIGGLVTGPFTSFEDINMDTVQEEITRTIRVDQLRYTLQSDTGPKKIFQVSQTGVNEIFDVTNNVPAPDEVFNDDPDLGANEAVVGTDSFLFPDIMDMEVIALPTNVSTAVPTLFNPNTLNMDLLTFFDDGTGSAFYKSDGFVWFIDDFTNELVVNFNDGEVAQYGLLFDRDEGSAIGVTYTKAGNNISAGAYTALSDNPLDFFGGTTFSFFDGIWTTNGRVELNDGTFAENKNFYRLNPNGTGQLEFEVIDLDTGLVNGFATSGFGICWQLVGNQLVWYRTPSQDDVAPGSSIPSLSTCSLLNTTLPDNTLIQFQRNIELLELGFGSEVRTFTENLNNPGDVVAMAGSTTLDFSDTFLRNFEPIDFFFGFNPPIAGADFFMVSAGTTTPLTVVSNDIFDSESFDPASVVIEVQPQNGIAVPDTATGDIDYTPNMGFTGTDFLYYRVSGATSGPSGVSSTIGRVEINVM